MTVHADRPVAHAVLDGRPVVVKRYLEADAGVVHDAMVALWASPFGAARRPPGMPAPLALDGDTIVMEPIEGEPIGARGSLGESVRHAAATARLLADLHTSGVVVPRRRDAPRLLRSVERKTAHLDEMHPDLVRPWQVALDELARLLPLEEELVVCHGDFSPRNVLAAPGGLVLIDFDRLQMADGARDVEYWRAWSWATELLAGQVADWARTEPFAAAYRAARPATTPSPGPSATVAAFHRGAALLRIAEGWSALRAEPLLARRIVAEALAVLGAV